MSNSITVRKFRGPGGGIGLAGVFSGGGAGSLRGISSENREVGNEAGDSLISCVANKYSIDFHSSEMMFFCQGIILSAGWKLLHDPTQFFSEKVYESGSACAARRKVPCGVRTVLLYFFFIGRDHMPESMHF